MLRKWFRDSETILWARIQAVIGVLAVALTFVDPSLVTQIIEPKYIPFFILANGIATEYLRRYRSGDE